MPVDAPFTFRQAAAHLASGATGGARESMSRRAILQIGTEKTGTTTLQHFLAANRDRAARRGFVYPEFCGAINHTGLAAYAMDARRSATPIREPFGAAGGRRAADARAAARGGGGRARRARDGDLLQRALPQPADQPRRRSATLRDFLARLLRRRADRGLPAPPGPGRAQPLLHPAEERRHRARDPAADPRRRSLLQLRPLARRSGRRFRPRERARAALRPRPLVGGDVVTDFLAAWEPRAPARLCDGRRPQRVDPARWRRSSCAASTRGSSRSSGLPLDAVRGPLAAAAGAALPGRGARPARADAEAFYGKFRPSNEAVRRRHFPDRETLFDEDFSDYPETEDRREFDADDIAAVAARLQTARRARRAGWRPRSRSATPACTGSATSRPPPSGRCGGRSPGAPNHAETLPGARRRAAARRAARRGARGRARRGASASPARTSTGTSSASCCRRAGDLDGAAAAQNEALRLAPRPRRRAPASCRSWRRDSRTAIRRGRPPEPTRPQHAQDPFQPDSADLAALDKVGLRLPGLRQTRRARARIAHRGADLDHLDGRARRLPRHRRLLQPLGGTINNVRFGRYCSVASGVVIGPHEHPTDWLTTSRTAYYPEVNGWDELVAGANLAKVHARSAARSPRAARTPTIGPDVWIGQGAFIKAGITIGAGAIIGARATVLRDVPPYAIVVGTPGRVLRLRFPEATVERLLALAWWRYSIYDLFDAPMDSIDAALDVIEALVASGAVRAVPGPRHRAADSATRRRWPPRSRRRSWRGPADRHPDQVALGADPAAGAERHLDEVEPEVLADASRSSPTGSSSSISDG